MRLSEVFAADAANLISQHGDPVVYTPVGGGARTIIAIVKREAPYKAVSGTPDARPQLHVDIAIADVAPETVTWGKDTFTVSNFDGGESKTFTPTKSSIVRHGPGRFTIRLT